MKRILTYTIFCLLFVLTSCSEEQLDVYNGDNYVYFTYMSDKSPQKITFNFATDAPLLREGTVKVKMTLLGYLLEENATCDISAVGEKSTALDAVENCLVGPAEYKHVTIQVTDRISQPVWWNQSSAANLGTYSDMKYRVFIIFMDGEILESLDKYTGIEFVNLIADFKAWWKDQWQQGNYQYYDTDGVTPLYETILAN